MGMGRRPLALLRRLTPGNKGESGAGHIMVRGWLRHLHEPIWWVPPLALVCYLFHYKFHTGLVTTQDVLWLPPDLWSIFSVPSFSFMRRPLV